MLHFFQTPLRVLRHTVNPYYNIPTLPGGSLVVLFTWIFIAVAALSALMPSMTQLRFPSLIRVTQEGLLHPPFRGRPAFLLLSKTSYFISSAYKGILDTCNPKLLTLTPEMYSFHLRTVLKK